MGDRPEDDPQQEQRGDKDEHGGTSLCDDAFRPGTSRTAFGVRVFTDLEV
ncbi:hypothetical protein SCMC78_18240 [Streptomyces sp. CMC78]|uniref:Uncharacterized protein n=1 Tax=Streptomyces sp. CMC78 TaxID=3231512 RepID=A0AB33K8B0_9ACTN